VTASFAIRQLKPTGAWAGCQQSIVKAERSGLLAHIATTESDSLCVQMKSRELFGT
jgi:hypothetical protein